jgi:trans-aconitate methyltransferase
MEAYPRLFARFKILLDPMFPKLAAFLCAPRIIIDIGTGYGVPAAWLLELFPEAHVFGIEPDPDRAHTAARVFGKRGRVQSGRAPDMPDIPEPADCALMLDMLHYLDDAEARETLIRLGEKLLPGAALIVRVTIPSYERPPVQRFIETTRLKVLGIVSFFRTAQQVRQLISGAGFSITCEEPAAPGREEIWFIAQKM